LQRDEIRLPALAKHAVAGAKSDFKAFTTVTIGDRTMIFSEIMTTHQALMLQNSTNCIFASKNEFLEVPFSIGWEKNVASYL